MLKRTLAIAILLLPSTLLAQTQPQTQPAARQSPAEITNKPTKAPAQIARLQNDLKTTTRQNDPFKWASIQSELSIWLPYAPDGDKITNLEKAIAAGTYALNVLKPEDHRQIWIDTQSQLIDNLSSLSVNDKSRRLELVKITIEEAQLLLTHVTRDIDLYEWNNAQHQLGMSWGTLANLEPAQKAEHLTKSIAAYNALFTSLYESPMRSRAVRQSDAMFLIAHSWLNFPTENDAQKTLHLQNAIAALSVALLILPQDTSSEDRAPIQLMMAKCRYAMSAPTEVDKRTNLIIASALYQDILAEDPKWTRILITIQAFNQINDLWKNMPAQGPGEKQLNIQQRVTLNQNVLRHLSKEKLPDIWGYVHLNLADALFQLANFPGPKQADYIRRAIASDKAALTIKQLEEKPTIRAFRDTLVSEHKKSYVESGFNKEIPYDAIRAAE